MLYITAAVALCAGATPAVGHEPKSAKFEINHSSWTYTYKGTKMRESVDADGKYITVSARGKHIDHGAAAVRGQKVCFTSAMNNKGENCWTIEPMKVGQSRVTTSDKGEKLRVTLIKYTPLRMPN